MCTYLQPHHGTYYFRRGVPQEIQHLFLTASGRPRTQWRWSLRVKDREQAKRLIPACVIKTDGLITRARAALVNVRGDPAPKPTEAENRSSQAVADEMQRQSHEAAEFFERENFIEEVQTANDPAFALELEIRSEKGLELRRLREKREDGEFLALAKAERHVALIDLFEGYAAMPGRHPKTIAQWRPYFEKLAEFLGDDNAHNITSKQLTDWRKHLRDVATYRGKRLAPKTINGSYLGALSTVLTWAKDDGLIESNPMIGVQKVKAPKVPRLRGKEFTSIEACTILSASLLPVEGAARQEWRDAKRWCPWLMAYTGTRVNEITQLRKEDIIEEDGIFAIRLTPEAGSIKAKEARTVPIHPHLVEQGFLEFVAVRAAGPLFYDPARRRSDNAINRQANRLGTKLAEWVRTLGIEGVMPNHAWRHLFNTLSIQHGLDHRVTLAIMGHSSGQVNQSYGSVPLSRKAEEIGKLPRFAIEP